MTEKLKHADDEQIKSWVLNDAEMVKDGNAEYSKGRLHITGEAVLNAAHEEMQRKLAEDSKETNEQLTIDEEIVKSFKAVFGGKLEAYKQQAWDVTDHRLSSGEFASDTPQAVDLTASEALVQLVLSGNEVSDDLHGRYVVIATNGAPMQVYSINSAFSFTDKSHSHKRSDADTEPRLRLKARVGYVYPNDSEGDAQLTGKMENLKQRGDDVRFFADAGEEQKAEVLRHLQSLEEEVPDITINPGIYSTPKRSETEAILA